MDRKIKIFCVVRTDLFHGEVTFAVDEDASMGQIKFYLLRAVRSDYGHDIRPSAQCDASSTEPSDGVCSDFDMTYLSKLSLCVNVQRTQQWKLQTAADVDMLLCDSWKVVSANY